MRKLLTGLVILVSSGTMWVTTASGESGESEPGVLFMANCAKCHGQNGVPKKIAKGAPNFNDAKWKASITLERSITSITKGKGKVMPPFSPKLSLEQIRAVAEYVNRFGEDTSQSGGGAATQGSTPQQ